MKLDVTQNVILQGSRGDLVSIQSEVLNRLADGNSVHIAAAEKFVVEPAHQCAAADEGHSEADSFFFREADHFDTEGQPSSFKRFQQSDCEYHSENSVVGSRIRHGI